MDLSLGQWIDLLWKGGAIATLTVFLFGFKQGWWIPGLIVTKLESAWELRAAHAEKQVEDLLPAFTKLTDAVSKQTDAIQRLTERQR